ncbi:RtcB family protein [Oligoflexia bacterium]|nr:RtcB family protein [Oligoflexia bacterium]
MKKRDLQKMGFEGDEVISAAVVVCSQARGQGIKKAQLKKELNDLLGTPARYTASAFYGQLAEAVIAEQAGLNKQEFIPQEDLSYTTWGEEIDADAFQQMDHACTLPVACKAALMPDAHVGYGLPIGGVLATENAVIPYAVGVDIACRVMLTVYDLPVSDLQRNKQKLENAIIKNTRFGVGAKYKQRKEHKVLDMDWQLSNYIASQKDLAWSQLGTSGSGNHFVEFGEVTFGENRFGVEPGKYIALVSHSGSRGPGNRIATHFSKLAMQQHPELPKYLRHLAWLSMTSAEGQEYWAAMELMGAYASANHHIIHKSITRHLNAGVIFQVENHHNFAWKEVHDGREVIVHRKGATPAQKGQLGYIPGSMVAPGYLVEGRGNSDSLFSCSHGAGRQLSRKKAKHSTTAYALKKVLAEHGVDLISAGLDESPHAYKDIEMVMAAQSDLVNKIAKFVPKIVKMAPEGERPED